MAARPYDDDSARYDTGSGGDVAAKIFIWLAWAAAAAFWGFSLTTGIGILNAMGAPAAGPVSGSADVGGVSWMLINFIGGTIVLGGALMYGAIQWASRDKTLDPMSEAATHALYDITEAAGGDDEVSRSPESRQPYERESVRVAREHNP